MLDAGELGAALHVEGNHSGPFGFGYDANDWHANPADTPAGGLTLMAIHLIDAMIGLIGPIDSVAALSLRQALKVPLDDTTAGMLRFRGGQSGYVSTLTATARQVRLQLYGTKGWAHMLDHHVLETCMNGEPPRRRELAPVDAERLELEAFASFVLGKGSYPVTHEEAVNGVAVTEAFVASTEKDGAWMKTA
jgi:predicted dehydrogenase